MQSDPIGLSGGLNTFTYVDSDPLSQIDPLGLVPGPRTRKIDCDAKDAEKCMNECWMKGEEYRGCKYVEVFRISRVKGGGWTPVVNDWKRTGIECRCADKAAEKCMATVGLILYLIVSEGSRVVFPPRNLVPVW